MEVEKRYTLFTLFTRFKLLKQLQVYVLVYIVRTGWSVWSGYPFDCYD